MSESMWSFWRAERRNDAYAISREGRAGTRRDLFTALGNS